MTIEDELLALIDDDGLIRPRKALDWARENPESTLHRRIEWDDAKAAENYRLDQVRQLIAIHIRTDDGARATISLIGDRGANGGYRQIDKVMSNGELRAMALRQALRDFRRWEQRYRHLRELAVVFEAANGLAEPSDNPGMAGAA